MTHILQQVPPVNATHLLVKKAINKGDTIIFQWEMTEKVDAINREEPAPIVTRETSITATNVETDTGLMKGWCIISWENKPEAKALNIEINLPKK